MWHARMLSIAGLLACTCVTFARAENTTQLHPGGQLKQLVGSTSIEMTYAKQDAAAQSGANSPSASITFDKGVRVNGNGLPAGTYEIKLYQVAADDFHVVFSQRKSDGKKAGGKSTERLRLAVRPDEAPKVDRPMIELEPVIVKPAAEGERRTRRRRPPKPSAKMSFRWASRKATINLEMTGVLWRGTPTPELPDHIREPWALVLSSLNGFVESDMDKHVEHFADNFISDWDDGGSQEAHEQFVGRMLFSGEFEGTILKLDKLEWTENGSSVQFREIFMYTPFGTVRLEYKVEKTSLGWKIVHLDGPKEE